MTKLFRTAYISSCMPFLNMWAGMPLPETSYCHQSDKSDVPFQSQWLDSWQEVNGFWGGVSRRVLRMRPSAAGWTRCAGRARLGSGVIFLTYKYIKLCNSLSPPFTKGLTHLLQQVRLNDWFGSVFFISMHNKQQEGNMWWDVLSGCGA